MRAANVAGLARLAEKSTQPILPVRPNTSRPLGRLRKKPTPPPANKQHPQGEGGLHQECQGAPFVHQPRRARYGLSDKGSDNSISRKTGEQCNSFAVGADKSIQASPKENVDTQARVSTPRAGQDPVRA